jgi:transposase
MSTLYTGIDVSQVDFTCSIWTDKAVDLGEFTNDQVGFEMLAEAIAPYQTANQYETIHIIVEATGGYELRLLAFICTQGWSFSLPNPKRVRDWAKGMGYRVKTDRIDGRLLAHYGYQCHPKGQQPVPEVIENLDSLLQRQDDVQKMLRQERNRQHALTYHPHAANSAMTSVERIITILEEEDKQLADEINTLLEANPELRTQSKQLLTVSGVGKKTVLPLLVLCHRYQARTCNQGTSKGITAYMGLDAQESSSGTSVWKRPTISKMGNSPMRARLYLAALGGVRAKESPLRDFYQRLVGRGKSKKLALVASSRKIVVWSWAVFQQGVEFDRSRFAPISN